MTLSALSSAQPELHLEAQALQRVREEYGRQGPGLPQPDPVLTAAARALAREALRGGAGPAAQLGSIVQQVSAAGGHDPIPRAVVVRATPAPYALDTFTRRTDLASEPATHVGVGAILSGESAVVVALFSRRKASLEPFPRQVPTAGGEQRLCGELQSALRSAELYLTRPSGEVERISTAPPWGSRFCASLPFPTLGRHTVEVIGNGRQGPEVAALFFVEVGKTASRGADPQAVEPTSLEDARAALLARINFLRAAHGAPPLSADPRLNQVAQAHSERMRHERFFAHLDPSGNGLRQRLRAAGYGYTQAGENLGRARGPMAAHFAIELSPGHRQTLLDPRLTRLGVGIAGDGQQILLTEVLARPGAGRRGRSAPMGQPGGRPARHLDQGSRQERNPWEPRADAP